MTTEQGPEGSLVHADGNRELAAESAQLVVGLPITSFRGDVGKLSKGPGSCTHLNDALRFLADAAGLVRHLHD
jgi:hypothetical protein